MIYRLSNRQAKELHQRGRPLHLVLPLPPGDREPRDVRRWASERLPDVAGLIAAVEIEEVVCSPSPAEDGPTGAIGAIRRDWREDRPCWCVPVARVRLEPARIRGPVLGPQWPGQWEAE